MCNYQETMNLDNISFHDSKILEVKEITSEQKVDFLLDYPVDWENNIFENRILRFKDVIFYLVEEIPFAGQPTILEVNNLGKIKKDYGIGKNKLETIRNKIEMKTNAGKRIIEFSDIELITPR